jgi:hypothetical protein
MIVDLFEIILSIICIENIAKGKISDINLSWGINSCGEEVRPNFLGFFR